MKKTHFMRNGKLLQKGKSYKDLKLSQKEFLHNEGRKLIEKYKENNLSNKEMKNLFFNDLSNIIKSRDIWIESNSLKNFASNLLSKTLQRNKSI